MYKIAVCDDMPEDGKEIERLVRRYYEREGLEHEICLFDSAESVAGALASGARFDIYFLDVLMPGVNGMELAKLIRGEDENCAIVFITISEDYAIDGYKVKALDYIVKPVTEDSLETVLKRVADRIAQIGTICIRIKDKANIHKRIDTSQIVYVESQRRTLLFHMRDGSIESVAARLDDYAPMLTKYRFFLRCQKSFLINMDFVKVMTTESFLLENGDIINISRSLKNVCKDKYLKYIRDKVKGIAI